MKRTVIGTTAGVASLVTALALGGVSQAGIDPAPPNDAFADAIGLTAPGQGVSGSTQFATEESGEPAHGGFQSTSRSVWIEYRPPADGPVIVDTRGSEFDTLLAIYTGDSLETLQEVEFNDDVVDGSGVSGIEFDADATTDYKIAVDGFPRESGDGDQLAESGAYKLNIRTRRVQTELTKKPKRVLRGRGTVTAKVAFTSPDEFATFECKLDQGSWAPCTSPRPYKVKVKPEPQRHAIKVRAVDPYGNEDTSPSEAAFKVVKRRRFASRGRAAAAVPPSRL